MIDTVETTHMTVLDLEADRVTAQPGLVVLSQIKGHAGGLNVINYILLATKGAVLAVPDRLGKKLVGIGFAREVQG